MFRVLLVGGIAVCVGVATLIPMGRSSLSDAANDMIRFEMPRPELSPSNAQDVSQDRDSLPSRLELRQLTWVIENSRDHVDWNQEGKQFVELAVEKAREIIEPARPEKALNPRTGDK